MRSQWEDPPVARSGVHFAMPTLTPVVKWLLIANVAVFLVQFLVLEGTFPRAYAGTRDAFALAPALWQSWFPFVPVWQLLTYAFLHGDVGHILTNLIFLYFLGTLLEGTIGSRRFLVFYGAAVAIAGLAQLVLGLALGHTVPIVGASGGVLAVACAMATLEPRMRVIFIIVPMTLKTLVLLYVAIDAFQAIRSLKGDVGNVAHFAHLAGAAVGFLAVRRGWIWWDPLRSLDGYRARVDRDRKLATDARVDELLAKIGRDGLGALSAGEKAFLKKVARRKVGR